MASFNPLGRKFEEIRLIVCVQGYNLNNIFVPREIGFWSENKCGVVPFNCRISYNKLSPGDKSKYKYLCGNFHGIPLDKKADNALFYSDCNAVLKTLYHSTAANENAKYIGYCRDDNMLGLLLSAKLSHLAIDLDRLDIFSEKIENAPSNKDLRVAIKDDNAYTVCSLHQELFDKEIPICAGVKAKYLGNYCMNFKETDVIKKLEHA